MELSTRHYIAAEVRAELGRQSKSRGEMAEIIGRAQGKDKAVSRQAVSAKLRGAVALTPGELVALAQWLGVPVAKFLPETVGMAS
jgi:transcriptional regulator with XRE-family HTH domain